MRRGRKVAVEHLHLPHKAAGVDRSADGPLAVEHLHLPHKAAGVERRADGPLAVEQLHLPHKAAGVDKTRLKWALAMDVTFIL